VNADVSDDLLVSKVVIVENKRWKWQRILDTEPKSFGGSGFELPWKLGWLNTRPEESTIRLPVPLVYRSPIETKWL
jgi:hypothetical protein